MMASPSSRVGVAVWQACRTVAWRVRAAVDALPPVGVIGTQQPPSQLWGGLQAAGVGGAATQPQAADREPQGLQQTLEDLVGALNEHIWFAVPKKRKSNSKSRIRRHAVTKHLRDKHNFYPCFRCDKGLLKLRHHLCPCDLEKVKASNIVKVHYGAKPRNKPATAPAEEA